MTLPKTIELAKERHATISNYSFNQLQSRVIIYCSFDELKQNCEVTFDILDLYSQRTIDSSKTDDTLLKDKLNQEWDKIQSAVNFIARNL